VGCEEQTLALSTAIEEDHQREDLASLSNFKGSWELKNLECSINYNARDSLLVMEKTRLTSFALCAVFGVSFCGSLGWWRS
jgi:hypothetical protein